MWPLHAARIKAESGHAAVGPATMPHLAFKSDLQNATYFRKIALCGISVLVRRRRVREHGSSACRLSPAVAALNHDRRVCHSICAADPACWICVSDGTGAELIEDLMRVAPL